MKLLLLSTDPSILKWRTLNAKRNEILDSLNQGNGADFTLDIQYINKRPEVTQQGSIRHAWSKALKKPYFSQGYDIIGLHFSIQQADDWGIRHTLLGANPIRDSELGDFWLKADEHTQHWTGRNQFVQTYIHEFCHEYFQHTPFTDITHDFHRENGNIKGLPVQFNWNYYQPERRKKREQMRTLEKIRDWFVAYLNQPTI